MPSHDEQSPTVPEMEEAVFLDNYGTCRLNSECRCLRTGWLGRRCPEWSPLGITNWDDLVRDAMSQLRSSKR